MSFKGSLYKMLPFPERNLQEETKMKIEKRMMMEEKQERRNRGKR